MLLKVTQDPLALFHCKKTTRHEYSSSKNNQIVSSYLSVIAFSSALTSFLDQTDPIECVTSGLIIPFHSVPPAGVGSGDDDDVGGTFTPVPGVDAIARSNQFLPAKLQVT